VSKIQDALRKIQSGGRPGNRQSAQQNETARVATVITEPAKAIDDIVTHDGRVVVVDRDLLRKAGLLAPEVQERHIADQYRIIKRPILDLAAGNVAVRPEHANLAMIASALPGDGKTFTAINIALSIAVEQDTSVLLVDADVAKPHISDLFGLHDEPGLIDLLVDDSMRINEAIIRSDVPGLSLMPAGQEHELATELLASHRMANVLAELSASVPNRIIIFDSPPLLVTSESQALASRMGQIALVVCAGITPQQAVSSAIETIDNSKAINLILNQSGTSFGDVSYGDFKYGYGDRISVRQ